MALLYLAQDLCLAHLLTAWTLPEEVQHETSEQSLPSRRLGLKCKRGQYRRMPPVPGPHAAPSFKST